jgi:hypothetical protein
MENPGETITDIIAEKRRQADKIERDCAEKMKRGEVVSDYYARELVADIRREANYLEAALKREKTAIEANALTVGGIVAATTEKSSIAGSSVKIREALEYLRDASREFHHLILNSKHNEICDKYKYAEVAKISDAIANANAALSAPGEEL